MPTVTALAHSRGGRIAVHVDGKPLCVLSADAVARASLRVGATLTSAQIAALRREAALEEALDAARRLLAVRPRSEAEIRQRLAARRMPTTAVSGAIAHLKRRGLLDDEAFARWWSFQRKEGRPQSGRQTERELRRKGVGEDAAREAVSGLDDAEAAYTAARKRAKALAGLDRATYRRRLFAHLLRRGFSRGVALAAMKRVEG